MPKFVEKVAAIGNEAVRLAQEENRKKGVANVYCLNGSLVWQLPNGTLTTTEPGN